jgi:hypothetical protein
VFYLDGAGAEHEWTSAVVPILASVELSDRERCVVHLRELGWGTVRIGRELGCSPSTALRILKRLGYDTSPGALRGDRISATEAQRRYGLDRHTLVRAVDSGRVRGERIAYGRGPEGMEYVFSPDDLEQDLNALPPCAYEGCDAPALGPSGGCERHGHVFAGDRARGVKRPDIGPKIAAAKRGKRRPDAAERLRAAWANRSGSAFTFGWARWHGGRVAQRWLGRWKGREHGSNGGRPRLVATAPEQAEIRRLADQGWGRRAIATRLRLSEWFVRTVLDT